MEIHFGWLLVYGLFSSALACASSQGDGAEGLWGFLTFGWFSASLIYIGHVLGSL